MKIFGKFQIKIFPEQIKIPRSCLFNFVPSVFISNVFWWNFSNFLLGFFHDSLNISETFEPLWRITATIRNGLEFSIEFPKQNCLNDIIIEMSDHIAIRHYKDSCDSKEILDLFVRNCLNKTIIKTFPNPILAIIEELEINLYRLLRWCNYLFVRLHFQDDSFEILEKKLNAIFLFKWYNHN